MSTLNLYDAKLYYRVNHPEFQPDFGYRALGYIDYGESAWAQILFVNERGMTYAVKVWRCLCLNAKTTASPRDLFDTDTREADPPIADRLRSKRLIGLPWPKPACKNPDLDDD